MGEDGGTWRKKQAILRPQKIPERLMSRKPEQPESEEEWVSKSQLKREMSARQLMGEKLCKLAPGKLAKIPMPEKLADAVALAKKIENKREGYRRQLQYIGKLMRTIDVEPIEAALDKIENKHQEQTIALHQCEQWRDKIIAEGDGGIQAFLDAYPQADRQQLRQLMRGAIKEQTQNKPPKSSRELFKAIRALVVEA